MKQLDWSLVVSVKMELSTSDYLLPIQWSECSWYK